MKKRIVVLGAGISGHTAAMFLKRYLKNEAEVTVISPASNYNWIPSNIWVGVGKMAPEEVKVPLDPIYKKLGVTFLQGKAIELWPEGNEKHQSPFVVYQRTDITSEDKIEIEYDYIINATGPKLNFEATPGLGPHGGFSTSVCTPDHATQANFELQKCIEEMKQGKKKTFLIGTGHGTCTCEGAAFEYVFNVDFELRQHNVRHMARVIYITNESELGDFGVNGMQLNVGGYITPSRIFAESLYLEREIEYILGAHVSKVSEKKVAYENLAGEKHEVDFDFAMLLPPFRGHRLESFNKNGENITGKLFSPADFMKVDANYNTNSIEEWSHNDWPKYYTNPTYHNVFAIGIAFAPPHQISIPRKNPNGTLIAPAPPRTGMPSATMGRIVAHNIASMIKGENIIKSCSLAELGAACVASAGSSMLNGSAATIVMSPIVPNFSAFPETGRDKFETYGEIGLAGHWLKRLLHTMFIYKAKANPFWWIIPE